MTGELAKLGLIGLVGLFSAIAVSRSAAVYHDGLRTSMIELWSGEKTRAQLARYAYGISAGFVVAYALPFSLASGILVMHLIFLGIDVIAVRLRHVAAAAAAGFAYAVLACGVVDLFLALMRHLPLAATQAHLLWEPVVAAVPLIGVVAAAQQFGLRRGAALAAVTLAVWAAAYEVLRHAAHAQSALVASGLVAFGVTVAVLVVMAWRVPGEGAPDLSMFDAKIRRLRRNWVYLVPCGALIALAASRHWLAGEPVQVAMLGLGHPAGAAVAAIAGAVSYFPVLGMTGLVSGVWIQQGFPDWILALGYLSGNPVTALVAGAAGMAAELAGLRWIARTLTRRPGITSLGHALRDAFDTVPALAVLAGGVLAAGSAAGPAGVCAVIGAYAFNESKGRPVMPIAVPVVAFVAVALVAGLARQTGLAG
jgi:hypothetical protein